MAKYYICKTFIYLASQEYLQSVKKYYNTEPQAVNFVEVAEEVRREINAQVECQTEGEPKDILLHILQRGTQVFFHLQYLCLEREKTHVL